MIQKLAIWTAEAFLVLARWLTAFLPYAARADAATLALLKKLWDMLSRKRAPAPPVADMSPDTVIKPSPPTKPL